MIILAIEKTYPASTLRLELRTGVSNSGNPVIRRKSLANIKTAASDADLHQVAAALAGLQQYPLYGISRVDSAQLVDVTG